MKRLLPALVVLLLALPTVAFGEEPEQEAVLESISYEKDENNLEKIIFKLNGTHIPKIFKIKGERPRLVFDFIDTRYSDLINNIVNTEGNLIKGVRVGIHDDPPKTRVVVDLEPEGGYKFEQDFLVPENILSITFHPREDKTNQPQPETVETKGSPSGGAGKQQDDRPAQPATAEDAGEETSAGAVNETGAETELTSRTGDPAAVATAGSAGAAEPANPILSQLTAEEPEPIDPILREVSFEATANDSEMVLFKLNDFYPPIVFGIEKGNPRVVCDFLDTDLGEEVRPVIETKGVYVSRIRTGRHQSPEKVRVVLDLVPNRNYDLQQVFFKEENLFVIIISEFEEEPPPAPEIPAATLRRLQ